MKHFFDLDSLSIYGDKKDIDRNPALAALVGHRSGDANTINLDVLRADTAIHAIKTHDLPSDYMSDSDFFLHVIRDGRDSVLSYYHYLRDVAEKPDTELSGVIAGAPGHGLWGEHTLRWHRCHFRNLLRVRFEDQKQQPEVFAAQISEWIGKPANANPFPKIEQFREAAPGFVRAGARNGWAEEFTPMQIELFAQYNKVAMRLAGYWESEPSEPELDAYAAFCSHIMDINLRKRAFRKFVSRRNRIYRAKVRWAKFGNRLAARLGLR